MEFEKYLTHDVLNELQVFNNSLFPDIYCHATASAFAEFCEKRVGQNTEYSNTIHGFFFANEKALERLRATNPGTFGDVILRVRLNSIKTLDLTVQGISNNAEQAATLWEIFSGDRINDGAAALEALDEALDLGTMGEFKDQLNSDDARKIMIKDGYDSITALLGDGNLEYVVFRSNQIQILSKEAVSIAYKNGVNAVLNNSIERLISENQYRSRQRLQRH